MDCRLPLCTHLCTFVCGCVNISQCSEWERTDDTNTYGDSVAFICISFFFPTVLTVFFVLALASEASARCFFLIFKPPCLRVCLESARHRVKINHILFCLCLCMFLCSLYVGGEQNTIWACPGLSSSPWRLPPPSPVLLLPLFCPFPLLLSLCM